MTAIIWTRAARDLLYQTLVARFGPYAGWTCNSHPSAEQRQAFDQFCDDFARLIGARSGRAVAHQIQWAIGVQSNGRHHWSGDQTRTAVLNMAAAFEAGFISHADFPAVVARNRRAPIGEAA